MDAGLNTSFEGYQSVGTIPPVLAARKSEKRSGTRRELRRFSPPGLLTAPLLSAKMASSLVGQSTLRRRLSLPAGTATQNFGRLHLFELPRPRPEFHKPPQTLEQLAAAFISAFLSVDDEGIFQEETTPQAKVHRRFVGRDLLAHPSVRLLYDDTRLPT